MAKRSSPTSPITQWLGIGFLLIGLFLAYLLIAFWPRTRIVAEPRTASVASVSPDVGNGQAGHEPKKEWDPTTHVLGNKFSLDADVRLLILVLLAGALGSYIHAVQSFASYVGNARFKTTWTWWYILRVPMGSALAVFVYFVVRGGLLAAGTATAAGASNDLNLFGIMSFSGLAGLFSKQAADKLAEVFDTLFATKEGHQREDKLTENPRPELTSIAPNTVAAASGETDLALTGQGFVKDSVVKASGKTLTTIFVSPQNLTAQLDTAGLNGGSEVKISVLNPPPGGGESDPIPVKVETAVIPP